MEVSDELLVEGVGNGETRKANLQKWASQIICARWPQISWQSLGEAVAFLIIVLLFYTILNKAKKEVLKWGRKKKRTEYLGLPGRSV